MKLPLLTFKSTFLAAAVEEEGVQCIVAPDIKGLAVLLTDAKGDVNETSLHQVLASKNWEATKAFTWEEMCVPLVVSLLACCSELKQGFNSEAC